MPEHRQHDDDLERLLGERVRAATATIRPRDDAPDVVRAGVGRRHRRRRLTAAAAAAVAVVAVAVPVAVLGLRDDGDATDGPDGPAPADRGSQSEPADARRPAAFFAEVLGGRAFPIDVSYGATRRQRVHLTLKWWPAGVDAPPRVGGVAVERYDGDAAAACEALGGPCREVAGGVGRVGETPADRAYVDPLARVAPFAEVRGVDDDATVTGATVFRPDGWAVTLTVCGCAPGGAAVDPGVTPDELLAAAVAEGWVLRAG